MNKIYERIAFNDRCKCEICQKEVKELKKEALEQEALYGMKTEEKFGLNQSTE